MRLACTLVLAWCVMGHATALASPQAQSRIEQPPYYAGVPIALEIVAHGFEESPQPELSVAPPAGAELELVGVSPSVNTSIQIVNGNMTQTKMVRFVYRYRFIAEHPGLVMVGPFRIQQASLSAEARSLQLRVQSVPDSEEQHLRLVLPESPMWVGQRVPVLVEWWVSDRLAQQVSSHRARVPLFDRVDLFKFEDTLDAQAQNRFMVDGRRGSEEYPAQLRRDLWEGEPYVVVTVKRTIIPLKELDLELEPLAIVTEEVIRWQQDLFGQRIPAKVRTIRAEDKPHRIVARAPPEAGRPASFSGSVGEGFTLEASADHSVVQEGDPIGLELTIRGDAALETVSLPALHHSGLERAQFRISDESVGGVIENGAKSFQVRMRVLHRSVREIPPIAFSWFDPRRAAYETTYSKPIALSVGEARVVSAQHVERATQIEEETAGSLQEEILTKTDVGPGDDLGDAELAIETDVAILLAPAEHWLFRPSMQVVAYALGLSALVGALWRRRLASLDPDLRLRRRKLIQERRCIEKASSVREVVDALRRMAAIAATLPRREYDQILRECDVLVYAPSTGSSERLDGSLRQRALSLAEAIMERSR